MLCEGGEAVSHFRDKLGTTETSNDVITRF